MTAHPIPQAATHDGAECRPQTSITPPNPAGGRHLGKIHQWNSAIEAAAKVIEIALTHGADVELLPKTIRRLKL